MFGFIGQDDAPINLIGAPMNTGAMKAALQAAYGVNYGVTSGISTPFYSSPGGFTIGPSGPPTGFGPPVYVPPNEGLPPPKTVKPPVFQPPLREPPPSPSPSPRNTWLHWRPRRMPRPVTRKPFQPRIAPRPPVSTPVGELCPIAGYVRRPIPGVAEEQIFRCTAGQPVVIDPGLREAGRAEAAARYGMHGLDGFDMSSLSDSPLLWIAGGFALYYFFIKGKR